MSDAALRWGAVSLLPDSTTPALPYLIEASSDGTNWGNPEAVVTAVQSRLQDGSLAVVDSYQNREAPMYLRVTSDTYDGLGAGEAALVAETRHAGYNTLSWTPSVSLAVPSVFDVVYATLSFDFDDLGELRLERRFVANLTCLPFPRSASEIVATAPLPPSSTVTTAVVDSGSSATGWTATPGSAVSVGANVVTATAAVTAVDSGDSASGWTGSPNAAVTAYSVVAEAASVPPGGSSSLVLTRAGTINTSVAKYLAVDVFSDSDGPWGTVQSPLYFALNSTGVTPIYTEAAPRNGYTRYWLQATGSSVTSVQVAQVFGNFHLAGYGYPNTSPVLYVDNILLSALGPSAKTISLTRTGTVNTGSASPATPYLMIDYLLTGGSGMSTPEVVLDGTVTSTLASVFLSDGYTRIWVQTPGASVGTITLRSTYTAAYPGSTVTLGIDQVQRTDAPPATGTRRQLSRSLAVAGTVRTQGRLAVEHSSAALGETLVYVYQNDGSGYVPPLRPFFVSGSSVTVDAGLYSGGSNNLNTLTAFEVPAMAVPKGNYRLMARLQRTTAGPATLIVKSAVKLNGTYLSPTLSFATTVNVGTSYAIFDLGPLSLPSTLLTSPGAALVRITIEDPADTGVNLDEGWIFNLDIGTLTHVDCGAGTPVTGGPSNRLWLDPATVTNNGQDAIFRGYSADRSDAFYPADSIHGWTPPLFEPPSMNVFTACNALDAAVSLRHYPRWLHNAQAVSGLA